ncbi:hypothetical protein INT45_006810 [Circinella minor]|uniref:Uncharacterized protein n=1 Tax=Circinella minor TaxID=1195481 RepID=A0A8H7RSN0_9FUNG|nr:hypothetical protein INT45_006810 [Circinella minor]
MSVALATFFSSSAPEVAAATTALGASVASVAPGDNVSIRLVGSTSCRVTFDVGVNGGNREEEEDDMMDVDWKFGDSEDMDVDWWGDMEVAILPSPQCHINLVLRRR